MHIKIYYTALRSQVTMPKLISCSAAVHHNKERYEMQNLNLKFSLNLQPKITKENIWYVELNKELPFLLLKIDCQMCQVKNCSEYNSAN